MLSYELNAMKSPEQADTTSIKYVPTTELRERQNGHLEKGEPHRSQDEAVIATFGKKQQLKVRCDRNALHFISS